jgi:hypothetical protein
MSALESWTRRSIAYRELVRCGLSVSRAQDLAPRAEALAAEWGDTSDDALRRAAHALAAESSGHVVFVLAPCTIGRFHFPPVRVRPTQREAERFARRAAAFGLSTRIEFHPKTR